MNEEIQIAEWLLNNKEDLEDKIDKSFNGNFIYSKELEDIYIDGILNLIKREIEYSFNLNPEELGLLISYQSVSIILGKEFFNRRINHGKN